MTENIPKHLLDPTIFRLGTGVQPRTVCVFMAYVGVDPLRYGLEYLVRIDMLCPEQSTEIIATRDGYVVFAIVVWTIWVASLVGRASVHRYRLFERRCAER